MQPRGTRWFVTALAAAGLLIAGGLDSAAQEATPAGRGIRSRAPGAHPPRHL